MTWSGRHSQTQSARAALSLEWQKGGGLKRHGPSKYVEDEAKG